MREPPLSKTGAFRLHGEWWGADSRNAPIWRTRRPRSAGTLSVDLPESNVQGAQDGEEIGRGVAADELGQDLEVVEGGRPHVAAREAGSAVAGEIEADLAARTLDSVVDLRARGGRRERRPDARRGGARRGWNGVRLRGNRRSARRRGGRPVLGAALPRRTVLPGQQVEALAGHPRRLAHLPQAHQVAVVGVAVLPQRHLEIELAVDLVGKRLAQVEVDAAAAQHGTGDAVVERRLGAEHSDAGGALPPAAVAREALLDLVEAGRQARQELAAALAPGAG